MAQVPHSQDITVAPNRATSRPVVAFLSPQAVGMALHGFKYKCFAICCRAGALGTAQGLGAQARLGFPAQTKAGSLSPVPCTLPWGRVCPAPPPQTSASAQLVSGAPPHTWGLCPGAGWKGRRDALGKWGIRGKPFTFIPPVGRRVEAPVAGRCPEALPGPQCSSLSHWGWP